MSDVKIDLFVLSAVYLAETMARMLTLFVIFGPLVACEVWAKNRNVTVRMSKTEMVRR